MQSCKMLLPIKVNDYVDFLFKPRNMPPTLRKCLNPEPFTPMETPIPIGYHGEAAQLNHQTNIIRPKGHCCAPDSSEPTFGLSKQLDFELEMAFVTNKDTLWEKILLILPQIISMGFPF